MGRERGLWGFIWWGKLKVCSCWDVRAVSDVAGTSGRDGGR